MLKGCLQCGYLTRDHFQLDPDCPDCGEPLVLGFGASQFGQDGALELQQEYCVEHGIERDWNEPLHPRTDQ